MIIEKILNLSGFFLLGLGEVNLVLSVGLISLLSLSFHIPRRAKSVSLYSYFGGINWLLFLFFYYNDFDAYLNPTNREPLNSENFTIFSIKLLLAFSVITIYRRISFTSILLLIFSFGMFCFAIANTLTTIIYLNPPFYGKAMHVFYRIVYNSPGTTILVSVLPLVFVSYSNEKWLSSFRLELIVLFLISALCLWVALIFEARTPLFTLGLAFTALLFRRISWNKKAFFYGFSAILLLIAISFLLLNTIKHGNLNGLINRLTSQGFQDKFIHTTDYFSQISENFWIYPVSHSYIWFHNFFFDAHRISGPLTAIFAYFTYLIPLYKCFKDMRLGTSQSKSNFILLMLFTPFLLTTIPFESPESQMTIFYACITAKILRES